MGGGPNGHLGTRWDKVGQGGSPVYAQENTGVLCLSLKTRRSWATPASPGCPRGAMGTH